MQDWVICTILVLNIFVTKKKLIARMDVISIENIPENTKLESFLRDFMDSENFSMKLSYTSDFSNTPKIRFLIEKILDIYSVTLKEKNRLVLVSDELNNNAVEHGTWKWWENMISIAVNKIEGGSLFVKIEVTDNWVWDAHNMERLKKEKDAIGFEKHHSIRGRGLFLITERIADRLYFKDADTWGLTVGIEKTLS